jgi:Tfp pilus assembly protein PilN
MLKNEPDEARQALWVYYALVGVLVLGMVAFGLMYLNSSHEAEQMGESFKTQKAALKQQGATVQQQKEEIKKQAAEIERLKAALQAAEAGKVPATQP